MPQLKKVSMDISEKHFELASTIYEMASKEFDIGSPVQLSKVFDSQGLEYPRRPPTALMLQAGKPGNPHLDKEALAEMQRRYPKDKLIQAILDYRHYNTLINMFLIPYLEFNVHGRLHCQFHPLKTDNAGTVSGRFSSSKPNLQQVPAMDDEEENENLKGKLIRKLFIPEENCLWGKLDYSQIEYRIMAHYAVGNGAAELRQAYRNDARTDYHQFVMNKTGFDRRTAKRLNFGATYGMGPDTAAKKFGWDIEEACLFMENYHAASPFIKTTRYRVINAAERRGYVFTFLGRKARLNPQRKTSSFFNRLIQGTAADIMKQAMVNAYHDGCFNALKLHLTVHDELDVSVPLEAPGVIRKDAQEALEHLKYVMETSVNLDVPILVDCHTGNNWAEAD